ncbi:MAG TPA: hypothetical protein VFL78_00485 [Rhodanobacteraceae bacterium]|nr:hypothetical protein [Rhodanobacteraceae bacterium]
MHTFAYGAITANPSRHAGFIRIVIDDLHILGYEGGHAQPSLDGLKKLAMALDCVTDILVFDPDEHAKPTPCSKISCSSTKTLTPSAPTAKRNKARITAGLGLYGVSGSEPGTIISRNHYFSTPSSAPISSAFHNTANDKARSDAGLLLYLSVRK